MPNIIEFLRDKYGNYWGERFDSVEAFKHWMDEGHSQGYFIEKIWNIEEYPHITLVQISDKWNIMWNEIIIIEGVHSEKELQWKSKK
jgi:hypothetical protein